MNSGEIESDGQQSFDVDAGWDFLSDLIDKFCIAWESAPPIPEFDYHAKELDKLNNAPFQKLGLIELVKADLEFRSGSPDAWRNLDWYTDHYPEIKSGESVPAELLTEARRLAPNAAETSQHSLMQDLDPDTTRTFAVHRCRDAHKFQPGDSVDDFDLLSKLGRGAFATVFLARQVSMQRLVALKLSADEGFEGPTLAKLNHPHVVRVFDQRVLKDQSLRLMYMEYVPGGTLKDVIATGKELGQTPDSSLFLQALDQNLSNAGISPPVESANREWIAKTQWPQVVAKLGSQLAQAIEYTHSAGILHRDIKPANILIDEHGYPKLVDFNISYGSEVIGATAASSFGGSLSYMSPEQLEAFHPVHDRSATEVGEPTDVYSLGITLCELIAGELPFDPVQESDPLEFVDALLQQKKNQSPKMVQELKATQPLLGRALESSLHRDADDRVKITQFGKLLRWSSDEELTNYFCPRGNSTIDWRTVIGKFPTPFVLTIVFGVSIFATWFVTIYNAAESVRPEDQSLFERARDIANLLAYPAGLILLICLFFGTWQMLRGMGSAKGPDESNKTIKSNLNFGHNSALAFISLWTFSGLLIPLVMRILGAELSLSAWIDFTASHVMAGLICGSFIFFGLTLFSIACWHPKLVMKTIEESPASDVKESLLRMRSRTFYWRIIAVGAPLVSIATLVNFRTSNTFAVSCLSIATLVGLAAISLSAVRINRSLDLLDRC